MVELERDGLIYFLWKGEPLRQVIEKFIQNKKVALAGASRNKIKWGSQLMIYLQKKGYRVVPVNPQAREINGEKCYASVKALPPELTAA